MLSFYISEGNLIVFSLRCIWELQLRVHSTTWWRWKWLNHVWGSEALDQIFGSAGGLTDLVAPQKENMRGTQPSPPPPPRALHSIHNLGERPPASDKRPPGTLEHWTGSQLRFFTFHFLIIRIKTFAVKVFSLTGLEDAALILKLKKNDPLFFMKYVFSSSLKQWRLLRYYRWTNSFTCEYKMWTCELDSFTRDQLFFMSVKMSVERSLLSEIICCCWTLLMIFCSICACGDLKLNFKNCCLYSARRQEPVCLRTM